MSAVPLPHLADRSLPLIIERPDLQSGKRRAAFHVLTGLFWLLWVVLWLPLITLLAWAAFGYQFHFHMLKLEGYIGFLDVLRVYALVIALMGGGLMVWAKYNHLRFRGMDRREDVAPPSCAAVAQVHGRSADEVAQWQGLQIATVHHTDDGHILRVDA